MQDRPREYGVVIRGMLIETPELFDRMREKLSGTNSDVNVFVDLDWVNYHLTCGQGCVALFSLSISPIPCPSCGHARQYLDRLEAGHLECVVR